MPYKAKTSKVPEMGMGELPFDKKHRQRVFGPIFFSSNSQKVSRKNPANIQEWEKQDWTDLKCICKAKSIF